MFSQNLFFSRHIFLLLLFRFFQRTSIAFLALHIQSNLPFTFLAFTDYSALATEFSCTDGFCREIHLCWATTWEDETSDREMLHVLSQSPPFYHHFFFDFYPSVLRYRYSCENRRREWMPQNLNFSSRISKIRIIFLGQMVPVRIRRSSHDFGWQSSHSLDLAGWHGKMASIENFAGYHDVMRTSPIEVPSLDLRGHVRFSQAWPSVERPPVDCDRFSLHQGVVIKGRFYCTFSHYDIQKQKRTPEETNCAFSTVYSFFFLIFFVIFSFFLSEFC